MISSLPVPKMPELVYSVALSFEVIVVDALLCEKGLLRLYDWSVGNDATGPSLVEVQERVGTQLEAIPDWSREALGVYESAWLHVNRALILHCAFLCYLRGWQYVEMHEVITPRQSAAYLTSHKSVIKFWSYKCYRRYIQRCVIHSSHPRQPYST